MKNTLTESEWRGIRDSLALGTSNEIGAGDTSHIEDHIALSDMTNYFPNVSAGRLEKTGDNEWSMIVGEMTMAVPGEDIDHVVSNPNSGHFMIVPDGFTTASAAPIDSVITMRQGPILAYDHITMTIARAEQVPGLESQVKGLATQVENLEPEVSGITSSLETLTTSNSSLENKVSDLEADVSTLTADKETLEGKVSTLESDNSTLNATVSTLESDSATLNTTVSQLGEDVATLSTANSTLEETVNQLQNAGIEIADGLEDDSTESPLYRHEDGHIDTRLYSHEHGVWMPIVMLEQMVGNAAYKVANVEHILQEQLAPMLDTLEGNVTTLTSDKEALEGQVSTLESTVGDLASDKEALEGQVSTLESTIADLATRLEALETPGGDD